MPFHPWDVYGNPDIAFLLPLLSLLAAEILPEGVQGGQLLQAHAAAAGEGAGELSPHLQQEAASGLWCGQHCSRGEPRDTGTAQGHGDSLGARGTGTAMS